MFNRTGESDEKQELVRAQNDYQTKKNLPHDVERNMEREGNNACALDKEEAEAYAQHAALGQRYPLARRKRGDEKVAWQDADGQRRTDYAGDSAKDTGGYMPQCNQYETGDRKTNFSCKRPTICPQNLTIRAVVRERDSGLFSPKTAVLKPSTRISDTYTL
jgi:hypothetical protein